MHMECNLLVYEALASVSGATTRATKYVRIRCAFLFRSERFAEMEIKLKQLFSHIGDNCHFGYVRCRCERGAQSVAVRRSVWSD